MKYQGAFSRNVGFAGKHFLFSPPPLPLPPFFCSHSNFRVITRLETLATQASVCSHLIFPKLSMQNMHGFDHTMILGASFHGLRKEHLAQ